MVHKNTLKLKILTCLTVMLLASIIPLYSTNPGSFIVTARPKDIWSPTPVTDLVAVATTIEGQVRLNWTAPTEDRGLVTPLPVSGYYIRFATFSVDSLAGDTTAWWNKATQITLTYARKPGEKETFVSPQIFYPGTTYYFGIKSYDDAIPTPNISQIDMKSLTPGQQTRVVPTDTPPAKVKNLTALYTYVGKQINVFLSWTDLTPAEKGLNFRYYCIYRDTTPPEGPWSDYKFIGVTGSNNYFDVIDVSIHKSGIFYYRVTGKDKPPAELEGPPSDPATVIWDIIPPSAPKGLVAVGSDRKVTLRWQPNTEPDLKGYNIYRSTYPAGYQPLPINPSVITTTVYEDKNVINGVTYYYVITALDIYNNESNYSTEVPVMPKDNLPPREPLGVKGIVSPDRTTMTLQWSAVTKNEDGTPCEDLLGYNIYRASLVDGVYSLKEFIPTPQNNTNTTLTWTDPENIRGQVFYYMVRAIDTSYNLSKISMIADSSVKMNIIAADEQDLSTHLVIPREINQILYKDTNQYGDDLKIEVIRNEEKQGRVIKSCSFIVKKGHTEEIIKDFIFAEPLAEIVIGYKVENGFVKTGNHALSIPEDQAAERLALFWFNGLEWIKLGGKVDEYFRTVSIKSKRVGKYMIKHSLRATSFEITGIQPDKTFTPNGDGWNDYFEIQYDNPKDAFVHGRIYDLRGTFVADMRKGANEETLIWDGKDSQGKLCSGGVYIYQIEVSGAENKIINGTVVLAR